MVAAILLDSGAAFVVAVGIPAVIWIVGNAAGRAIGWGTWGWRGPRQ